MADEPPTSEGRKGNRKAKVAEARHSIDTSRMYIELAKAYLEFSIWVPKMIAWALVIGLTLGAGLVGLVWWLS